MADLAQCGIPAKFRAQALGRVPPGLWIYPRRGPGSLGSCSYFSLPGRQTDRFVRAGEPDTHRDLWQYYQEATHSFGDTFHLTWCTEDAHTHIKPTMVKTSSGLEMAK